MDQAFYRWVGLFFIWVGMPLIMLGQADSLAESELDILDSWKARGQIEFRVPPPNPELDSVEVVEEFVVKPAPPRDSIPGPTEFVLFDVEPRCLNHDSVKYVIGYPPMAKEKEIEGKVILRVLVDRRGNYIRHVIIKDPDPMLTEAVQKHILKLRFTPAILHHAPVWGWVTVAFDFRLLK